MTLSPQFCVHPDDCDFETLVALADQMPRERFEQIKVERPDFARWLNERLSSFPPREFRELHLVSMSL